MQTILFHPDPDLCRQIETLTAKYADVLVLCTSYEELFDSGLARGTPVVAAGNGFGIMDGGLERTMRELHGAELETWIREEIIYQYGPELPVGSVVGVDAPDGQWIVYAPTMQGPMCICGTDNVYRAARAAAHHAQQFGAQQMFMPLLGCGCSGMEMGEAVDQMLAGVSDGTKRLNPEEMTWAHADRLHRQWHRMVGVPEDGVSWAKVCTGRDDDGQSVGDPADG